MTPQDVLADFLTVDFLTSISYTYRSSESSSGTTVTINNCLVLDQPKIKLSPDALFNSLIGVLIPYTGCVGFKPTRGHYFSINGVGYSVIDVINSDREMVYRVRGQVN